MVILDEYYENDLYDMKKSIANQVREKDNAAIDVSRAIKRSNPKNTEMPPMLTMYIILYFLFQVENNFMVKLNNHNSIY